MTLYGCRYRRNNKTQDFIKKSLQQKVTKYKMRIQKPMGFLCINNELAIKEIKKAIPFTIATKR